MSLDFNKQARNAPTYSFIGPVEGSVNEFVPGDSVVINKKIYIVHEPLKPGSCRGCDLYVEGCCVKPTGKFICCAYSRHDKQWIIFKRK